MAKRKKSKGSGATMAAPSSGRSHLSVNIDDAENGYIVNASGSGSGDGDYWSKRYIAKDRGEALKISNSCLAGGHSSKGGRKKAGGKKKTALKRG